MTKYIDADALYAAVMSTEFLTMQDAATAGQLITEAPAAEVVHIKQGEWFTGVVYIDEENVYMCSVCAEPFILLSGTPEDNKYNYCPHCGAKMK